MVKKTETKSLYRSTENRVIAGVCGGLGEYFNLDPELIRIIFLLLAFFGGSGFPIYFVLWLIIPSRATKENIEGINTKPKDIKLNKIFGITLVIIGIAFLMENFGFHFFDYVWKFWPALIIMLGVSIIFKNERE